MLHILFGKKIYFIATELGRYSGASQSALDIISSIASTGFNVTVVGNYKPNLVFPHFYGILDKIRWVPHFYSFPKFPNLTGFTSLYQVGAWIKYSLLSIYYTRLLKNENPELILINGFGALQKWSGVSEKLKHSRENTLLIVHESPGLFQQPYSPASLSWACETLKRFDKFVFVSSRSLEEWKKYIAVPAESSYYIPNCCNEEHISSIEKKSRPLVRKSLGLSAENFVILCVASLQHHKGQDIIVSQYEQILAKMPTALLIFIGPIVDNEWTRRFLNTIEATEKSQQILLLGPKANALEYIYAADLLVLPSRTEAMPRVILEAMALKTPVVASNVDGIPELIEHGKTGYLYSNNQPETMVGYISLLARDGETRQAMVNEAHYRYWSHFSRKNHRERFRVTLNEIMN